MRTIPSSRRTSNDGPVPCFLEAAFFRQSFASSILHQGFFSDWATTLLRVSHHLFFSGRRISKSARTPPLVDTSHFFPPVMSFFHYALTLVLTFFKMHELFPPLWNPLRDLNLLFEDLLGNRILSPLGVSLFSLPFVRGPPEIRTHFSFARARTTLSDSHGRRLGHSRFLTPR